MLKTIKLIVAKYCPDYFYSLIANLYYFIFNHSENIRINKRGKYWRISRANISIFSPTAKYTIPNYAALEATWERYFRINPGDTIIDIGACLGEESIFAVMKTGPTGFVYSIDASPNNVFYLRKNVENFKNIQVIDKAISNTKAKVKFYDNESIPAGKAIIDNNKLQALNNKTDKFIEVDTVSLDNSLEGLKGLTF